MEYSVSDLEPGTYTFRVIAYGNNGNNTIKSEYYEKTVKLDEPDGLRTHKTETGNVDATAYVKENYPALYDLYRNGEIGLTGEGKRDMITLGSYAHLRKRRNCWASPTTEIFMMRI